jgi:hypothetical protein
MDFAGGLRAAIDASGQSLEEIVERVAEHGSRISASSLSAWQSGLSSPSRAKSLQTIPDLERVLGIADGGLSGLLPTQRARRRGPAAAPNFADLWIDPTGVSRLLARMGAVVDDLGEPEKLSRRLRLTVDAGGNHRHLTIGALVRARHRPATRMLYLTRFPWVSDLPVVAAASGLAFHRFRGDHSKGLGAFELHFDPVIPTQGHGYVEFTIVHPPRLTTTYFNIRVAESCRELSMTVSFDPARLPRRCWAFRKANARDTEQLLSELTANRAGTTYQLARLDPPPGIYGIRWEFPALPSVKGG